MNQAVSKHQSNAASHQTLTFATLARLLSIETDHSQVATYLRSAFQRVIASSSSPAEAIDKAGIFCTANPPQVTFNGQVIQFVNPAVLTTPFRAAFYGSSKLFRLSFRSNIDWTSFYGAGLCMDGAGVLLAAHSGTGKTTLSLELLNRGAKFYSDEYVFIRHADKFVSGLPKTLMIRERTLPMLGNPRIRTVCAKLPSRNLHHNQRVWDFVDVGAIFGDEVFAQPAPLKLVIILERSESGFVWSEQIPSSIAAADVLPRLNAEGEGFTRLMDVAKLFSGVACYRIGAGTPARTADTIQKLLRA